MNIRRTYRHPLAPSKEYVRRVSIPGTALTIVDALIFIGSWGHFSSSFGLDYMMDHSLKLHREEQKRGISDL